MRNDRVNIKWLSPGPIATAFMASTKRVQFLNGPIGSGKTTANFIKHMRYAARQAPSTRDGVRKYKLCVVRDTYRQVWKTTLPTWFKRVPRTEGEFVGAENAPATHRVTFQLRDQTWVEFQIDFVGIGENAVEDVMRGYEPTAWMLNEVDLLSRDVYAYARGRWGRYPDMDEGGPSWWGITGDCNAPELDSWLDTEIFDDLKRPDDVDLFIQPSGFSPRAENSKNLVRGYYIEQSSGQEDWYIKRMIENVPGYSRKGKPVYSEYNDELHVSTGIYLVPHLPLWIGIDAGGTPAAVFVQRLGSGVWWVLDELVAEKGTGPLRFGDMLAQKLKEDFSACRQIRGFVDPSACYGADKVAEEKDWREIVANKISLRIDPAPSNLLTPRREAVRRPLSLLIEGKPAFQLHPRCAILRKGFSSGYKYREIVVGQTKRYSDEPEKNDFSHPHDALQYALLSNGEDEEIRGRKAQSEAQRRAIHAQAVTDWDPFAQQRA